MFSEGCWTCDDDVLQAMLQALVDPRAPSTPEAERSHALYAAGRYGGLVLLEHGWVKADMPPPEITMEDIVGKRPEDRAKAGWLSWMKRKK